MASQFSRKSVLSWMLFDWANQPFHTLVVTFIFAPYFASQVVGDATTGQAIWGTATAIGGLAIAVSAPLLGAVADRTGYRKPWVFAFSIPFVLGCLGLWIAVPDMETPTFVLVLFVTAFVGAEFTQLFTNAMLPDLGPRREIGRISGSGWALGYVGGLVSLVAVLALLVPAPGQETTLIGISPILGLETSSGEPSRAVGPLSAVWYLIFSLPFFLYTSDAPKREPLKSAVADGLSDLMQNLGNIRTHDSLLAFLIASMIYRDALVALFAFGGIYAAGVLGWGLFELGVFGIVAAGTGAIGAWLGGFADRAFGPKPVVILANWLLIFVGTVALLTSRESVLFVSVPEGSNLPDIVFFCAGGLLGAAAGTLQAASRSLLVRQASGRIENAQAFGLYAFSGKATAFIGPGLIAMATALTGSQRLGVSPVLLLFLIALVLLHWVKTEAEQVVDTPHDP